MQYLKILQNVFFNWKQICVFIGSVLMIKQQKPSF